MAVLLDLPKKYLISVALLSIAGIGLALFVTFPWGAGISGDAMRNLSVAANVFDGKGFFIYDGSPFLAWPPLYPVLLGILSRLTMQDIFVVGWYLNVFLCGVNIWLAGMLFGMVFRENLWLAYLSSFFVFLSLPLLKISANIASDPLFISIILLFLIILAGWDGKSTKRFVILILLVSLATLQRLLGIALIPVAPLFILLHHRKSIWRGIGQAFIFGLASSLPLLGWLFGHNYFFYGTLFGFRTYNDMMPWSNFLDSLGKMLDWFYPYYSIQKVFPNAHWYAFAGLTAFSLLINKKASWLEWLRSMLRPMVWPGVLFAIVYFIILMFTSDFYDQMSTVSDRYQVVILIPMLITIGIALERLFIARISLSPKWIAWFVAGLFCVWTAYSVVNLAKYVTISRVNGENSYNLYNNRSLQQSPTIAKIKDILQLEPDANVYSNIPAVVWFFTRHNLESLPYKDSSPWQTKDEFKGHFAGWPYDKPGYIVWFEPDPYKVYYSPDYYYLITDMRLVSQTSDGKILYVTPKELAP
jgi:hypothetical protein